MYIYTVVENGEQYLTAYTRYEDAVQAVKIKHKEILAEAEEWSHLPENKGLKTCNEIDVPEAKNGPSILYIEKGIHIEIHKIPVETQTTYSLEDIFTVVARNSFHLTKAQRNQLFQHICAELEERYNTRHADLREAMKIPDLTLDENCRECG